ncbi:hypothetical protein ABOM_002525 [Aspergillus bombycis]|uniref:Zn(2)-C6 fungal-type domain-containing protein n=1 Tax=Aspergillus bombycis TaxID=109264 RepID=A0A1F8A9S4_9EURO|nr:hypothetical protein ABOM_002525 [Aspergillus bombycis]OGM48484.1 hypothetical protein ABOM_002525 [Aspergillus bombycis]
MDDDGSPTKTAPKFTRCRTGCLRCRKRRRKCDEGKPRCQNCIDKNLDCQYGLQVSFLQKNTFTVTASELRTPKSEVNYDKIKFVQEDPLGCTTDASVEDSPSPVASIPEAHPQSDPIASAVVIAGERKDSDRRDSHNLDEHYGDGGRIHHDTLDLSHWDGGLNISPDGTPHRDKDDAVQGLLALGSTAGPNSVIPESTNLPLLSPGAALSSLMNTQPSEVKDIPLPTVPTGLLDDPRHTSINGLSTSIIASIGIESEARRLELLRHYRYHVATWLDICDLRHPFGINVIQMAASSEKLLSAVLVLSETCIIQRGHWNRGGLEQLALRKSNQLDQLDCDHPDSTELILLYLLEDVRCLVTDVPKAWVDWVNKGIPFVNHLVEHAYSKNIESTAYWMFLRIDLGVALANDIPLRIPLPMLPIPSLSLLSRTEDVCERVSHYTNAVLWLCGKALALCHQEAMPHPLATSHEVTENWLQAFGELEQWQHLRPLEFEPMVEIDARDQVLNQGSEFPLLLFANGAGTFSNQIYHTAMLLLLQCKPRTALLNHPQSPVLSPLWHAYRICGIALNNDTRESWDPCLLASLLLAAKHMTHESQQQEILQGFDRIREITGWGTGEYLSHLQEEWSFLDGI